MFLAVRLITLVVFCTAAICSAAQSRPEADLELGKLLSVVIDSDKTQSFALYLPTDYDPKKKFPILFCFDPGGRGAVAVEKYRKAAEKYGYILVGSNNSRNGLDGPALTNIIKNLTAEANRRLSIDPNRVSAAGLSGGARVASLFATACGGCVFGVVGSGAGFSPGIKIDSKLPFIFFGTVGYEDFNYPEFHDLEKQLAGSHVVHRIEMFDGGHQWLSEPLAGEALAWLEIRAIKAGRREKDDRLIDESLLSRSGLAEHYFNEKKFLEAYREYLGVVDDFSGLRDVSRFSEKVSSLESSAELKRAVRAEADEAKSQLQQAAAIIGLGDKLRNNEDGREQVRVDLHREMDSLTKHAAAPDDTTDRRVARRTLAQVYMESFEASAYRTINNRDVDRALENLEIAGEINPKNPQIAFNKARVYAVRGDKRKAIDALEKAIELGFKDADRIANDKAFSAISSDERFLSILAKLKP